MLGFLLKNPEKLLFLLLQEGLSFQYPQYSQAQGA